MEQSATGKWLTDTKGFERDGEFRYEHDSQLKGIWCKRAYPHTAEGGNHILYTPSEEALQKIIELIIARGPRDIKIRVQDTNSTLGGAGVDVAISRGGMDVRVDIDFRARRDTEPQIVRRHPPSEAYGSNYDRTVYDLIELTPMDVTVQIGWGCTNTEPTRANVYGQALVAASAIGQEVEYLIQEMGIIAEVKEISQGHSVNDKVE